NSAHDSACACCTDEVADQVLVRYAEARQIGDALAGRALAGLAAEIGAAAGDVVVVNTRPPTRSGIVEVTLPAGADAEECLVGGGGWWRPVRCRAMDGPRSGAAPAGPSRPPSPSGGRSIPTAGRSSTTGSCGSWSIPTTARSPSPPTAGGGWQGSTGTSTSATAATPTPGARRRSMR